VHPVATQLAIIVDDEEDQVAVLGVAKGVRLDAPCFSAAVLRPVIDVDVEAVDTRRAEQLERTPSRQDVIALGASQVGSRWVGLPAAIG
jgi:hypothetical protein